MGIQAPTCPNCESPMVLRTSRRGAHPGTQFYGCSTFPRCRAIRPLTDDATVGGEDSMDQGTAGGSAQQEFERRVARREERVKNRFGQRVGGVLLAITGEPQSTRAWARGAEGERELAESLAGAEGIRMLHDRRVPGTRGNIDHIVVGPAGIFVVDTKFYAGLIKVRDVGGLFRRDERLYVGRKDCSKLAADMTWQMEAVEAAVTGVEPPVPVTPVLCFVKGEWPLLGSPSTYADVRLESTRSLRRLVQGGSTLDTRDVERVTQVIAASLPAK